MVGSATKSLDGAIPSAPRAIPWLPLHRTPGVFNNILGSSISCDRALDIVQASHPSPGVLGSKNEDAVDTRRLESPTDGVFAVAITVLVFDPRLPISKYSHNQNKRFCAVFDEMFRVEGIKYPAHPWRSPGPSMDETTSRTLDQPLTAVWIGVSAWVSMVAAAVAERLGPSK